MKDTKDTNGTKEMIDSTNVNSTANTTGTANTASTAATGSQGRTLDKELYPEYVYPEFKGDTDAPFRPVIAELGKKITDRIPQKLGLKKITAEDPEYIGLAAALTDEEAAIALKMDVRVPATLEEMVKKTGLDAAALEPVLETMSRKGILEYNCENERHEKQYVLPMYVPGSAEFFNMNARLMEEKPEMGIFFERMSRLPLEAVTPFVPMGGAGIGMHVIPVEKAIPMESESVDLEHISHWLSKYEGKYAKSPCSCRRSRLTHDEGCADDPEGWCIAVGDMADYVVETEKGGVYITRDEALEILKTAEDNGFVHQITNIDGAGKIFAICNCNVNVCYALRTSQLFNTPNLSRSAYIAEVDTAKCVACGKCVEVCPAGAPKLGQKLCRADGSEVSYPRQELPGDCKWDENHWTHNYRDINRINCYDTGTAPCKTACPAHIAIQGYIRMAKEGRYAEALELIKKDNPLPAVCGRICNRRCEDACTRGAIDEAVQIDEIKRFIAERDLNAATRYIPKKIVPSLKGGFEEKIAIIGSGPAGLSCAYFLALMGYKPTVFEKNSRPGGMLRYGIPSFKLEKDLLKAEIEVIRALGVEFRCGVEVGRDITLAQLREQGYKGFYVGIGCQAGKRPNIPGADAAGTVTAVDFLREAAEKESYALSGDTIVIGGGNVAIDAARTAVRCGSGSVTMISLEDRATMPATAGEISDAEGEGIRIINSYGPKEILTENGRVTGVVFKKCTATLDETGRFNPQYDEDDTMQIACGSVIFSIGQAVEWGGLIDGEKVAVRLNGGALANKLTYQTSVPDIFVGGDVYTGPKFAIDAIAAGREGAISLHRFVHEHCTLTIGRNRRDYKELNKSDIRVTDYDRAGRSLPDALDTAAQKETFRDLTHTLTEEQMKAEANRCLGCGASIVDPHRCLGCGLCTTKCMFDAIHLRRVFPEASEMMPSEDKLKVILPNMLTQSIKVKFKTGTASKKFDERLEESRKDTK